MPDVDKVSWAMGAQVLFVLVALGLAMLLVREKTRAMGIKVVGGLALVVLVFLAFVSRGVRSWEHNHWQRAKSHLSVEQAQADHAAEHAANNTVRDLLETPSPIALPDTTSAPPAASEGRPPEPMPEIVVELPPNSVAEREPAAAPAAATAPATPLVATTASDQRPAWVDLPARREGEVYIVVANSGPFVTDQECAEALVIEAQEIARRVIDDLIGPGTAAVVQSDQEYVRRLIERVCKQSYTETRSTSVGPMKIMHVRMEFDDQTRADLKQRWRQAQLEVRLRRVAGGSLWVLALVGAVYSFLKVDTATKGYYTKRLQVGAVVVILTIIALGLSVA